MYINSPSGKVVTNFYKIFFSFQIILIIIFFFSKNVQSQIVFTNTLQDSSQIQTDFTKQNATWNWRFRLMSVEKLSDYYWDVTELFNRNLITPKNSPNRWKDEYKSKRLLYKLFNKQKVGLYTDSWILIDKQNENENENEYSTNAAGMFMNYDFNNFFSFTPYTGFQKARNVSITDWGWDTGINGKVSQYKLGDYNTSLRVSTDLDLFENRQNYLNEVYTSIATSFNSHTSDSLKFTFEESSKEFYDLTDSTGEKLTKVDYYNRSINNTLFYNISSNGMFLFQTNIESKDITYLTKRKIFFIGSQLAYQYFSQTVNFQIDFKTSDETQDNEEIKTDRRSRQSSLGAKSFYNINSKNNLKFDVTYSKLQYDTPDDSINNDDRDEQRIIFDMKYWHSFSPVLLLSVSTYGFLFHQIYLSRERSHNNNWNRILQLSPEISYKSKNLSNRLSTSITANYTEYDFDNLFLEKKSFLSREYTLSDSLLIPVYTLFNIGFFGRLEKEEKGNFFAKSFSQNIVRSFTSKRINTFVTKRLFQKANCKVGYAYFKRKEWRHLPEKQKIREVVYNGPFFNFDYEVDHKISISLSLSINYFDDNTVGQSSYIDSYLKLLYYL